VLREKFNDLLQSARIPPITGIARLLGRDVSRPCVFGIDTIFLQGAGMGLVSNLSITKKLILITMGASGLALLLSTVVNVLVQGYNYRESLAEHTITVARAIGTNNVAALTFEDEQLGRQALSALANEPSFLQANLYDENGSRLAYYDRRETELRHGRYEPSGADRGARLSGNYGPDPELLAASVANAGTVRVFEGFRYLDLITPVVYEGDLVGFVHIRASLSSLFAGLAKGALIAIAVVTLAMAAAYFLAMRMQGLVSAPIIELVDLTRRVSSEGDYSLRATVRGSDEVNTLISSFNAMLDEVNARDEKLAENQRRLVEANDKLKEAVRENAEAREAAEAANRAKSDFLARMSHEVRTPMNGVIGMLELLARTSLTGEQKHYIRAIDQSSETLLAIINDILDFSKIEAGKFVLDPTDIKIREPVEDTVELLAGRAASNNSELVYDIAADADLFVVGDGIRLRQVLMNLVGNACKFTADGEIRVHVSKAGRDGDRHRLRFEIRDTGIGIREENLDRIFESFSQEDGGTTRRYGGTGLGLAICRELVTQMDGEIGVDSEVGKGSTFWFEVPFELAFDDGVVRRIEELAGHHVLIVDDNQTNREMLSALAERWKMTSIVVDSADAALEALRQSREIDRPFDLALLDWHMPDKDGIELAREIGADPVFSDLPLVLLSSASVREVLEENDDVPVAAYLTKPVRQARLEDCLLHLLVAGEDKTFTNIHCEIAANNAISRLRVLLVEDNAINQQVANGMLTSMGCDVEIASNGRDAVEMLEQAAFDIVLMDCQMPIMDGYAATGAIREREGEGRYPRQTIIALTANALPEDRDRCIAAGMDDYLSKPFTVDKLRAVLESWLPGNMKRSA
jgi:two-component system sensor histidine kinase/response regulator